NSRAIASNELAPEPASTSPTSESSNPIVSRIIGPASGLSDANKTAPAPPLGKVPSLVCADHSLLMTRLGHEFDPDVWKCQAGLAKAAPQAPSPHANWTAPDPWHREKWRPSNHYRLGGRGAVQEQRVEARDRLSVPNQL
ncbi:MAG TPA: hypothetical protein VKA15_25860, partial [Isosphaeraceae bacterium]|nr:hypothetical protein [Isosphaeraceae bacterium]